MFSNTSFSCYNLLTMLSRTVISCCTAVFDRFQNHIPGESLKKFQVTAAAPSLDNRKLCELAKAILPTVANCVVAIENRRASDFKEMPKLVDAVFNTLFLAIKSYFVQTGATFHLDKNLQIAVLEKCKVLLEINYKNAANRANRSQIECRNLSASIFVGILDQLIYAALDAYGTSGLNIEPLLTDIRNAPKIRWMGEYDCISPWLVRQNVLESYLAEIAFTLNTGRPGTSLQEIAIQQICFSLLAVGINDKVSLAISLDDFLKSYVNDIYWHSLIEAINNARRYLLPTQDKHLLKFSLDQLIGNNHLGDPYHKTYVKKVNGYWRTSIFIFGFMSLLIGALVLMVVYIINRNSMGKLPNNNPISANCRFGATYQGTDPSQRLYYQENFQCDLSESVASGQYTVNTASPNQYACNGLSKASSCVGAFNGSAFSLYTSVWSPTTGVIATGDIHITSTDGRVINVNPATFSYPLPSPNESFTSEEKVSLRGLNIPAAKLAQLFANQQECPVALDDLLPTPVERFN